MASVLIVDDDRALRKLLRAYLEQESISVVEAGSGEEALAAIAQAPPSLVLLDVRLPGIDGFEVLQRLDARGTYPEPFLQREPLVPERRHLARVRNRRGDWPAWMREQRLAAYGIEAPASSGSCARVPRPRKTYGSSSVTSETTVMSMPVTRWTRSVTAAISSATVASVRVPISAICARLTAPPMAREG